MQLPVFNGDLYADEVIHDRFPVHTHLRALGPVVWSVHHLDHPT